VYDRGTLGHRFKLLLSLPPLITNKDNIMINGSKPLAHPIRWSMVGGGSLSQIGYSHRSAALRDHCFTLVAGAFDLDTQRGRTFGAQLGVNPDRCYPDYLSLFEEEARRADGIQAVTVATPNGTHFAITKAALEAGLHVVCEKPLCFTVQQAHHLRDLARERRRVVGLAYGYAGHQMICICASRWPWTPQTGVWPRPCPIPT